MTGLGTAWLDQQQAAVPGRARGGVVDKRSPGVRTNCRIAHRVEASLTPEYVRVVLIKRGCRKTLQSDRSSGARRMTWKVSSGSRIECTA